MEIDINFLIVIIGFYGAIIAFFVPLSIDMTSKIGKMYETEIVAERFKNENEVKNIHIHLLLGICVSAFILALNKIVPEKLFINVFIFFIAIHFLYMIHSVYYFVKKLRFYTDTDAVLTMLQQEIDDAINRQ